jgi:hypothetical protein
MEPNHPIPTLAYRTSPVLEEEIVGRRALPVERFGAGSIDWAITWFGGTVIVVTCGVLTDSEPIALAGLVAWCALAMAFEAARGVTVGRRVMGLLITGPDGVPATQRQFVIRALVQRLWLWPLLAMVVCEWIDRTWAGEEMVAVFWGLVVALGVCLACWIVNCIICLTQGSTIPDRLSGTRVIRPAQR